MVALAYTSCIPSVGVVKKPLCNNIVCNNIKKSHLPLTHFYSFSFFYHLLLALLIMSIEKVLCFWVL